MRIGSIARTDGPGRHQVALTRHEDASDRPVPAYGTLVRIRTGDKDHAGIVVGITAVDTLGGRYDDWFEQAPGLDDVFDLEVGEKLTLVEVAAIGTFDDPPRHAPPDTAAPIGAPVEALDDEAMRAFHLIDGRPRIGYYTRLAAEYAATPFILESVLQQTLRILPEAEAMVQMLQRENALAGWRRP